MVNRRRWDALPRIGTSLQGRGQTCSPTEVLGRPLLSRRRNSLTSISRSSARTGTGIAAVGGFGHGPHQGYKAVWTGQGSKSPVRRPKVSYESNAVGLDRNELGVFLVQAGLAGGRDHALAWLLALNGLRWRP
jgi:hypothetical protein